jgi:hypothetical protein
MFAASGPNLLGGVFPLRHHTSSYVHSGWKAPKPQTEIKCSLS